MIERINEFIKNQSITILEFERKISASDGVIRKSIRNNTDIQSKWLVRIAENYPILDMNWVLTGEGSMYRTDGVMNGEQPDNRDETIRILNEQIADKNKIIALLEIQIATLEAGGKK